MIKMHKWRPSRTVATIVGMSTPLALLDVHNDKDCALLSEVTEAPPGCVYVILGSGGEGHFHLVWLWDLESGLQIGAPLPVAHLGTLRPADFPPLPVLSPDSRYVVVSGSKGTAMWVLDPELWRDAACERAGRNMTGEESQGVMGETPYRSTCLRSPPG
jgi:hypothetical protein